MLLKQIDDRKLSQYAYLIGCEATGEALLIDPERDIDRYVELAEMEDLEVTAVAETHIHADFLSGAREFAERFDTTVYLSDEGGEEWQYGWVDGERESGGTYDVHLLEDGDSFTIGRIEIKALHTPGHTPEHLSYLVTDSGGGADRPMGLASGDFLFVNDVGRPDLLESAAKVEGKMEPSARRMYRSIQRFLEMPDYLQIWPGHGAGSACGKALGAVPHTTAGYEKMFNPMIAAAKEGEETFVREILKGQPEPQMYFARMKRDNRDGPPLLGSLPRPQQLTHGELSDVVDDDESIIVDTRFDRSAYMKRHIPGSLYAPMNRYFNTVVGSLQVDETVPIVLVIEENEVEEAVRDLVRIGYDRIVGFATEETLHRYFDGDGPRASIEEITFDTLEELRSRSGNRVLDVRLGSEYEEDHVPEALNASYTRLPEYVKNLPEDTNFLVHCATGRRAASASSFLAREGRKVKYVNDDFENAARSTRS